MAAGSGAGRRELSRFEAASGISKTPHGVRERGLSQRRRLLEPADGDIHDSRQRLYSALRFLRGSKGRPAASGL
jgi:hypothetical protein